ncbi:MAG TPA: hypothetical protein VK841_22850 [Polyangiaceae bacterium]|nr:hypothetical protein [Polyangiaceae bacterium]
MQTEYSLWTRDLEDDALTTCKDAKICDTTTQTCVRSRRRKPR